VSATSLSSFTGRILLEVTKIHPFSSFHTTFHYISLQKSYLRRTVVFTRLLLGIVTCPRVTIYILKRCSCRGDSFQLFCTDRVSKGTAHPYVNRFDLLPVQMTSWSTKWNGDSLDSFRAITTLLPFGRVFYSSGYVLIESMLCLWHTKKWSSKELCPWRVVVVFH